MKITFQFLALIHYLWLSYGILVAVVATLIIKNIVKGLTSIVNIFGCKICLVSIIDSGFWKSNKKQATSVY